MPPDIALAVRGYSEIAAELCGQQRPPGLLGAGERLFDGVQDPGLEPIEVIHSPRATHVRYRIGR